MVVELGNLNDVEFEALCRDVLAKMLDIPSLRRFAPGQDGGIDLTDDTVNRRIVVQVKHYFKSGDAALIRALEKELPNVQRLQPAAYYVCCSNTLSPGYVRKIRQIFGDYMPSDAHIITGADICDFLRDSANQDICDRHPKLWLDSRNSLEAIFNARVRIDSELLLDEIEELRTFFVPTTAFYQALRILEEKRALCIIGNPGVGKSITSKMLVSHYADLGYRVRYIRDPSNTEALFRVMDCAPGVRDVILLDDCFGQTYLDVTSGQSGDLAAVLKMVSKLTSKVVILNSRITILQEARALQAGGFPDEASDACRFVTLDISQVTARDKAQILQNHLVRYGVPREYREALLKDRGYETVISHRNYNPRIIEFVCSPGRYRHVRPDDFPGLFRRHLDNPEEMWRDEYERKLQPADRILLQTLYSLTSRSVGQEKLRECFERRLSNTADIDKSRNQFNASLARLTEGFIRVSEYQWGLALEMANPSVNDFLDHYLRGSASVVQEIRRSICTVAQLARVYSPEEFRREAEALLVSGKIHDWYFESSDEKTRFIGSCIVSFGLCLEQYRAEFWQYLRIGQSFWFGSRLDDMFGRGNIFWHMTEELWDFYELDQLFAEPGIVYNLLAGEWIGDAAEKIRSMERFFNGRLRPVFLKEVRESLENAIDWFCQRDVSHYDPDLVKREYAMTLPDGEIEYVEDAAGVDELTEMFTDMAREELDECLQDLPEEFQDFRDRLDEYEFEINGIEELICSFRLTRRRLWLEANDRDSEHAVLDEIFSL